MGIKHSHDPGESEARSRAEKLGVDLMRLPVHVGIIMDGNGRWAQLRGMPRLMGHHQGYKTLRSVLLYANDLGIKFLTVYAFSAENWRRTPEEVEGLLALIEQAARDELRVMHQNNVRVQVAGRLEEVPESLRRALVEGMETTKNNTGITFTLAINYGGRQEIVDAIRQIICKNLPEKHINEETVRAHLYIPNLPDPDLLIRTAGELRLSNFLLWQSAYSEIVVCPKPWPEFTLDDLLYAIKEFQKRTRKFGGVVE